MPEKKLTFIDRLRLGSQPKPAFPSPSSVNLTDALPPLNEKVLQAVQELEIRTRRNISSLLTGNYRSAFRGSGMQFKEFRHYEPGDDIRHMSWPITARTGRATIKVFEEERELDVTCLVDCSGSSLFGSKSKRKVDMYAELMALIGLAALKSGDNVGFLFFDDKPRRFFPPKRARSQVLAAISYLLSQPLRGNQSDVSSAISYAANTLSNRSLVLILSDFLTPPFTQALQQLATRHEVILLHGYDDAERGLGIAGVYEACDPETGECFPLDGNSKEIKKTLNEFQSQLTQSLEKSAEISRSDYLMLSTDDDYLQRLVRFFRRRGPSRV